MWNYLKSPTYFNTFDPELRFEWTDYVPYGDSFQTVTNWNGLIASNLHVKTGNSSALWDNHGVTNSIVMKSFVTDWSNFQYLTIWVYNEIANNETIAMTLSSENTSSPGYDYYIQNFKSNFVGWNQVVFNKSNFGVVRNPLGWANITGISIR